MIKAYVLIVTNPGATRRVAETLRDIPGVEEIHEVMGPYDIVAEIETESLADVPGILAIYNDVLTTSTAIYREEPATLEAHHEWFRQRLAAGYPVLVATDAHGVAGFASFGDFRPWPGYRFTVEHSVHVRGDCRGRGVGGALMTPLITRARDLGKHVMIAGVDADNALDAVGELLTQAKELAVRAGNDTLSPQDRKAIGEQVSSIREQVIALANTRGTQGYLFGGTRTDQPPVTAAGVSSRMLSSRRFGTSFTQSLAPGVQPLSTYWPELTSALSKNFSSAETFAFGKIVMP